ncbi:MAG: glycine cleavage T C-terminal barrel domain-containing protein [Hyphomicrobiales bacterium]
MTSPVPVYHLALRETHAAAGATFGQHLGWWLPEHYGDVTREYQALRSGAAVLDRSFRSRFMVTGTDAQVVLDEAFEGHVHELEEGRAVRTVALDGAGHIRDLVLIARTGGIAYVVSGEPAQRAETRARLEAAVGPDFDVRIDDRTETTCLLAVAGPAAAEAVERYLSEGLPPRVQHLQAVTFEFHGFRTLAMRTRDVGEDGFEFMVAPAVAQHLMQTLGEVGVPLAGFAAQETARIESCIPAFVPDLEPGLSPAEADLDVLLGVPGGAEGRILSAVLVDGDSVPATGTRVSIGGEPCGEVRSSAFGIGVGSPVALALVESRRGMPGTALDLDGIPGTIVAKPFYRRRS